MTRLVSALLLGLALATDLALGQELDSSRICPVTVPIRDAGIYDLGRGTWARGGCGPSIESGPTTVYNNTCTWAGGGFFCGVEHCEDIYDEGRIPSTSDPNASAGATDDNRISSLQTAYCTAYPTGSVDIRISLWGHNGGGCVGWVPQSPIVPPSYNGATAYLDLSGAGLPGDNQGGGNLSCWIVTIDLSNTANGGFCLLSDGDGSWTGPKASEDQFNGAFQHEMDNATYGTPRGPLFAADPWVGAPGTCTYAVPCSTDVNLGHPCGTGLGWADVLWINADGTPFGGPAGATCPGSLGTDCFFSSWPTSPYASLWLKLDRSGPCTGIPWEVYCTGKRNSQGCVPFLMASGRPDASSQSGFLVAANDVVQNKFGLTFWGNAPNNLAFHDGILCVHPPLRRVGPPILSGSGFPDCHGGTNAGQLVFDYNAIALQAPTIGLGSTIYAQVWFRDPNVDPFGDGLTDAIRIQY